MNPMGTLKEFSKILQDTLIPQVRKDGFKGSMPTFRWISSPVIQIIHFQGTTGGGACIVNIGIHLDFLFCGEFPTIPQELCATECMFADRIRGVTDGKFLTDRWSYTQEGAERMVRQYLAETRPFFHHFRCFPDAFFLASPEDLLRGDRTKFPGRPCSLCYMADAYAKLYEYIGDTHTAKKFSEVRKRLGDMAPS